jgi:hypothetical protein
VLCGRPRTRPRGASRRGALANGEAWVQFCLTSGDESDGYSDMQFVKVRAAD